MRRYIPFRLVDDDDICGVDGKQLELNLEDFPGGQTIDVFNADPVVTNELRGRLCKRAKMTDFMSFSPCMRSARYVISMKAFDAVKEMAGAGRAKFFPVSIGVQEIPHLLWFHEPVSEDFIDYSNSRFVSPVSNIEQVEVGNFDQYKMMRQKLSGMLRPTRIALTANFDRSADFFFMRGLPGICVAEDKLEGLSVLTGLMKAVSLELV